MKRKLILGLIVFTLCFTNAYSVDAALVTINNKGVVIWQVLGDSNMLLTPKPGQIQIKNIAENINPTNNSQILLNNDNGKIQLSVKGSDGQTQNIDATNIKENLVEVQERGNANDLQIGSNGNEFNIIENGITAQTSFPITIDPIKNELSVTTASGSRLVSILPYEAILSLMRGNFINNVNLNHINLTESTTGELQYQVNGKKNVNIFNLAQISAEVDSTVSASTGEILKINQPVWLKFLGFLFT